MAEYIERDFVLDLIGEHQKSLCPLGLWGRRFSDDKNAYDEWQLFLDEIDSIPAADVAPVVYGRWVDNGIPGSMLSGCSVCGFSCGAFSFSYCPHCGAKMDKEEV